MAKRNLALTRRVIEGLDDGGGVAPARSPLRVWQVTAVDTETGTCTIKMVASATGTLLKIGEHSNVLYAAGNAPSVGAQGLLVRLTNGTAMFFAGGGGAVDAARLAYAAEHMTQDGVLYRCILLTYDGTNHEGMDAYRLPGVNVVDETRGCIVTDATGLPVFMPAAHYAPPRSTNPQTPVLGEMWIIEPTW